MTDTKDVSFQESAADDLSRMAETVANLPKKPLPDDLNDTYAIPTEENLSILLAKVPEVDGIGGKRAPKVGCYLSIQPVPYLDEQVDPDGPLYVPRPPVAQFLMADNYEDLRARIIHELDNLLDTTKTAIAELEKSKKDKEPENSHGFKVLTSDDDN